MDENVARGVSGLQEIDDSSRPAGRANPVSLDLILSAVANEHRRAILHSLNSASDGRVEFDALVTSVADWVGEDNVDGASDEHRQRTHIELHHTHLPKLEEARIIDYDTDPGRVEFVGGKLERDILSLVAEFDAEE